MSSKSIAIKTMKDYVQNCYISKAIIARYITHLLAILQLRGVTQHEFIYKLCIIPSLSGLNLL